MRCEDVRERLVAHQDGELAPAEHAWVAEHLAHCPTCRAADARLRSVAPRRCDDIDDATLIALQRRLDAALDAACDEAPADEPLPALDQAANTPAPWWRGEARVPVLALVAWATALALVSGWGLHQWTTAQELRLAMEQPATPTWGAPGAIVAPDATLSPEQFRPASYRPQASESADSPVPSTDVH